jgi:hypothetical protein
VEAMNLSADSGTYDTLGRHCSEEGDQPSCKYTNRCWSQTAHWMFGTSPCDGVVSTDKCRPGTRIGMKTCVRAESSPGMNGRLPEDVSGHCIYSRVLARQEQLKLFCPEVHGIGWLVTSILHRSCTGARMLTRW